MGSAKVIWCRRKDGDPTTKDIRKTQSAVRTRKNQGAWFRTDIGTRQGDPLSLLPFIVYLERVMNYLKESKCGINISETLLNNLRFADNIGPIDEECSSRQKQFETTRIAVEEVGLVVNTSKVKTMVFSEGNIE